MKELTWLEGYSGETVEQLIALEGTHRIDSLVLAFEEALSQKAERVGRQNLSQEEETVLAIEALEREVNNGGYHQFFVNTMESAPTVVHALRQIGCPQAASITQTAIDALNLPVLTTTAIEEVIYDDDGARDEALGECDDRFYANTESIEDNLFAYVKANKNKIAF